MRLAVAALILAAAPAAVQAQPCEPQPGRVGAGPTETAAVVLMHSSGHIIYAKGPVRFEFAGEDALGFRSHGDCPAREIFSDRPAPRTRRGLAVRHVRASIRVLIGPFQQPRVQLEILGPAPVLRTVTFTAQYSANNVLHGTDGPYDVLVKVTPAP